MPWEMIFISVVLPRRKEGGEVRAPDALTLTVKSWLSQPSWAATESGSIAKMATAQDVAHNVLETRDCIESLPMKTVVNSSADPPSFSE
jgi:hypothetical protein